MATTKRFFLRSSALISFPLCPMMAASVAISTSFAPSLVSRVRVKSLMLIIGPL